ncbi:hypothetical protein BRUM_1926, partial [Bifidobacterium ruminantium]
MTQLVVIPARGSSPRMRGTLILTADGRQKAG